MPGSVGRRPESFSCPVCGGGSWASAFRRETAGTGLAPGIDLRPTSSGFGATLGRVVRCSTCGHGSLLERPSAAQLASTYAHVEDGNDDSEAAGRSATARRDLERVGRHATPVDGPLLDIGCWTGSLVATAESMGWRAEGLEPSAWAVDRARRRALRVRAGVIGVDDGLDAGHFGVVTCCDVVEHLLDPRAAVDRIAEVLRPGGVVFVTVPDSGSVVARALGARWWSVLPMHVQYFTRSSLAHLLRSAGFEILAMTTHPKVFSRRYYADRFGEFVPLAGPAVARAVGRSAAADAAVAPDFRDRIAVIARKPT